MTPLLSPSQQKILESLAKYTFLTSSQMVRLEIISHRKNLSRVISPLKKTPHKLIAGVEFPFVPSRGRLENFYYLTAKGRDTLVNSGVMPLSVIKYPRGNNVYFTQDYFHRKYTIDCHIACDLAALQYDYQVVRFDRYIDMVGSNRGRKKLQAKTKVALPNDYIIADATLLLQRGNTSRLFALELYNDRNIQRITQQIEKHMQGIQRSSLCSNYGVKKGHRLLAVCTKPEVIAPVQQVFVQNPMKDYILFASYETVQDDFLDGWSDVEGNTTILF